MMNSTSDSSSVENNPPDPESLKIYVYYYIGFGVGLLLLMMSTVLFSYYCSGRNHEDRWQSRGRGSGGGSSNNSNSNRTVILVDRDSSVLTMNDVWEEQREEILNSFPMLLYSQVKQADSTSLVTCSICLTDYKESEWLRFLPDCGHYFHKECVDAWFRLNLSCPMCRNSPLLTPLV